MGPTILVSQCLKGSLIVLCLLFFTIASLPIIAVFSAIYRNTVRTVPNVILQAAYKELEQFNGEPQQPALYDKVSFDNLWK